MSEIYLTDDGDIATKHPRYYEGLEIGFDFARYGLKIEENHEISIREGYKEGLNKYLGRKAESTIWERKLLRLRYSAFKRSRTIAADITSEYLEAIFVKNCPVTREELTIGTGAFTDGTVDRVFNDGGYARGNLAVMSRRINEAKGRLSAEQICDIADSGAELNGLNNTEWNRLASLVCLNLPSELRQMTRPLLVLPPPGTFTTNGYMAVMLMLSLCACGSADMKKDIEVRNAVSGKRNKKALASVIEMLRIRIWASSRDLGKKGNTQWAIEDAWEESTVYGNFKSLIHGLASSDIEKLVHVCSNWKAKIHKPRRDSIKLWNIEACGYQGE